MLRRSVSFLERLTRNSYPGILCGIAILILTGLPVSAFPPVKPIDGLDKVVHALMYAAFAFACLWGYRQQIGANDSAYRKKAMLVAATVGIALGCATELMQEYLVTSRSGDWLDLLADGIGTASGILLFSLFMRRKK